MNRFHRSFSHSASTEFILVEVRIRKTSTLTKTNPYVLKKTDPLRARSIVDNDAVADDDATWRGGQGMSDSEGGRRRQAYGA